MQSLGCPYSYYSYSSSSYYYYYYHYQRDADASRLGHRGIPSNSGNHQRAPSSFESEGVFRELGMDINAIPRGVCLVAHHVFSQTPEERGDVCPPPDSAIGCTSNGVFDTVFR